MASVAGDEFARVMEGYQLIQGRVQQELRKQGLRRVVTVGQRVDPTCMTVVDIVDDPSLPPETVVEELRPGYLWRKTVIRCADVRAVKSRGSVVPLPAQTTPSAGERMSEAMIPWDRQTLLAEGPVVRPDEGPE